MQLFFEITLSKKDEALLEKIKNFFNASLITKHISQITQLQIQSLKELESVINNFHKYPLITEKRADFNLIIMVNDIIRRKEHLTQEGLIKIIAIKASMNRGLSEKLKLYFPDVVPVVRPIVENPKVHDPN